MNDSQTRSFGTPSASLVDVSRAPEEIARLGDQLRRHLLHDAAGADGAPGDRLTALFTGKPLPRAQFERLLGGDGVDGLLHHGVLVSQADDIRARLALHCVGTQLTVTDLPLGLHELRPDTVDPLWEAPTLAELMIDNRAPGVSRAGVPVDIGCGSGVLSMALAATSNQVFGGDVNPRALTFARFNRVLNRVDNLSLVYSDLFAGFGEQVFDRIVSNAPVGDEFVPKDFLRAGEGLLERIFRELPDRLAAGGIAQMNVCGQDWTDSTFLARIDRWLGASAEEFQFVFLEKWRTDRGPRFALHRLQGTLASGRNCFACKAIVRGWLTLRRRPGRSWVVNVQYQDWIARAPTGSGRALIQTLLDAGEGDPLKVPAAGVSESVSRLLASARPASRAGSS